MILKLYSFESFSTDMYSLEGLLTFCYKCHHSRTIPSCFVVTCIDNKKLRPRNDNLYFMANLPIIKSSDIPVVMTSLVRSFIYI